MRALAPAVLAPASLALAVLLTPVAAYAAAPDHARVDKSVLSYVVHDDLTWVETAEQDETILTARGIRLRGRASRTFHPGTETAQLAEAWVTQPDGTRVDVTPDNVFTRPSAESQSAPGFSATLTTTVVWPQLNEGSHTHVKWIVTQKEPALLGFNVISSVSTDIAVTYDFTEVTAPVSVPVHWAERGGYATTDTTQDGVRHITAVFTGAKAEEPERNAVSDNDSMPVFVATSLPNLEALGATYYAQAHEKAAVTPEIAALAHRIAGDKQGLAAVRAVNDWVATRIRYVAVFLDPNAGYVPHPAAEVLRNGYGDCKDHVVIVTALLDALGIEAQAAVIDWGTRWQPMPTWTPYQFNHAIVYLPAYDMFLNPTNPFAALEAQDRTLAGKLVVIATPTGRVMHTPETRPEDYRSRVEADVRVAPDGTVDGRSTIVLTPSLDSTPRSMVANASSARDLADQILLTTPEGGTGDLTTSDPKDLATPFRLEARWHSPHGVPMTAGGAEMAVPTGVDFGPVSRLRQVLSPAQAREHPVLVGARDYGWTTTIHLPAGLRTGTLPAPVNVLNPAGSYTAEYERTTDGLRVTRRLVLNKDVYKPEETRALEQVIYAPLDDARAVVPITLGEAG